MALVVLFLTLVVQNFNAHAFTIELGKVQAFGENDMASFIDMANGLSGLISQAEYNIPKFDNDKVILFKALGDITKETDDFSLYVADDVSNFTDYPVATLLATDSGKRISNEGRG